MKSIKSLVNDLSNKMLKIENIRKNMTHELIELDETLIQIRKIHLDLSKYMGNK